MLDWHYDNQLFTNYKEGNIIIYFNGPFKGSYLDYFNSINLIKKDDINCDILYCFVSPQLNITDKAICKDAIQWVTSHDFENDFIYGDLIAHLGETFLNCLSSEIDITKYLF